MLNGSFQNAAKSTTPLSAFFGKETNFKGTPIYYHNFQALKKKLMTSLILQFSMRNGNHHIETDASNTFIGIILMVLMEGEYLPVF